MRIPAFPAVIGIAALAFLATATEAPAQRLAPGTAPLSMMPTPPVAQQPVAPRWGGTVNGRWYAGNQAPGGWRAYRQPVRGWTLPRYWFSPSFFIGDFSFFGLATPPYGYRWVRYYDDAVMVDDGGRVRDSVSGIDWDRYDRQGGYWAGAGGAGGSAYGYGYGHGYGAAGGAAGHAHGGAGGAGGGYGVQGYPSAPPPPHGAYGAPYVYQVPPPVAYAPPAQVVQPVPQAVAPGTVTTYTYSAGAYGYGGQYQGGYAGGGYVAGGYWYPPVTTTTVTVQSAPVIETITTEYIEETVTTYAAPRKVYRAKKKAWKPRPKARKTCGCECVCR